MNKPINPAELNVPGITTGPLPSSMKVYTHPKADPSLSVPHRAIQLHPSAEEPDVPVYDTSGPYSDPAVEIDLEKGLPRPRTEWVKARGHVEEYEGRDIRPEDNGNATGKYLAREFPVRHRPLSARALKRDVWHRAGLTHHQGDDLCRRARKFGPPSHAGRGRGSRRGRRKFWG